MSGSAALDMSLDDLIKTNKKPASSSAGGGGRFRGRGSFSGGGPGPSRRLPNRSSYRPSPYAPQGPNWDHDLFGVGGNRSSSIETEGKLYISNLEYGVSNEDIKELFGEVGEVKRHSLHYDRSGRSKGTAEVVFARHQDAVAAVKRYNNVQLDGKPMKIEIVGTNIVAPAVPAVPYGSFRPFNGYQRSGRGMGGPPVRGAHGGGRGFGSGFGRGRGRGRGRDEKKVSAEDLDAELEKYHTEAMQTN